jgi:dihydropteroate synthase
MELKEILKSKKTPLIMGVLNLTPDSFSDGGKFNVVDLAVKRILEMEREGADLIDIGGESTGPNSKDVSESEEISRVIPILKNIRKITKLPISIDTYKAEVARLALDEGVDIVNDVTALRGDKNMVKVVAKAKCPFIMMYSKDNTARTTVNKKEYKDVVKTIDKFFVEKIFYAQKQGILKKNLILDPGMGQFVSAIPRYSFEIINRLEELKRFGLPLLIGVSRKSFLMGKITERLDRGLIASVFAYLNGVGIIRTHDVSETVEFFKKFNN